MHQFEFNNTAVNLKTPAAVTADTFGILVDLESYTGQGLLILNTGAGTADSGVTPALVVTLQSSATSDGTFADVSGAAFTARATAASHEAIGFDLRAANRYCKLEFDITGSGASYLCAAEGMFNNRGW